MKEKLPSVRNHITGYEIDAPFPLITRQEARVRLKCAESFVDKLRNAGVLYSINSTWARKAFGVPSPHDPKFWAKLQRRGSGERVGIRQSDVEEYWDQVRKPFLAAKSHAEIDAAMAVVPPVSHLLSGGNLPTEFPNEYHGIGVPVKNVHGEFTGERKVTEPMVLHQVSLQEEEHRRIEDMINIRLMDLELNLEPKIANEVSRIVKDTFRDDLKSARTTIVHDICKDMRNETCGLAEKCQTNFEAINRNMKKVWDTTKELDEKLSRTYVSFAEVQEKTWKHIKRAVKSRILKPKPSLVSRWRKFMTKASSPTNSTGNNTTKKVGKGKE